MEPKENHRKTRLTKNEKMTITLAKVMARSTSDFWMARAPALFFRLELADAIVYKFTTAFIDFNFTFLFIDVGIAPKACPKGPKLSEP